MRARVPGRRLGRSVPAPVTTERMPSWSSGLAPLALACVTGLQAQASPGTGNLPFRIPDRVGGYHLATRPASTAPADHLMLHYRRSFEEPPVTVGLYPLDAPGPCPLPCDATGLAALVGAFSAQFGPARAADGWSRLEVLALRPLRAPFERPRWPAWHLVVAGARGSTLHTLHFYWVATPGALVTARTVVPELEPWDAELDGFVSRYAEQVVQRLPSRPDPVP